MNVRDNTADETEIRKLIGAHFEGMKWTPTVEAEWGRFSGDFLPGAALIQQRDQPR